MEHGGGGGKGPKEREVLAQRRNVVYITGGCRVNATAGLIKGVVAVEEIARGDGVTAQLQILLSNKVEFVPGGGQDALNWAYFNAGAGAASYQLRVDRPRIAS